MIFKRHKKFKKQFNKLPTKIQSEFGNRLDIFKENQKDKLLNIHKLEGKMKGKFSMNVSGDVRAIYEIIDGEIYFFLLIGTHSELY